MTCRKFGLLQITCILWINDHLKNITVNGVTQTTYGSRFIPNKICKHFWQSKVRNEKAIIW